VSAAKDLHLRIAVPPSIPPSPSAFQAASIGTMRSDELRTALPRGKTAAEKELQGVRMTAGLGEEG
jgi:hypothetical protein